ncbi:unnamed protein product [Onchocerca flexuosa]|uniref:Uncharacterized protein n=1 Tax=Onchocerca flexuosa TaxID=387005 RepID=A0A183HRY9_9BILA|nr:unnamed protein product [Onchocerca flexuosa]
MKDSMNGKIKTSISINDEDDNDDDDDDDDDNDDKPSLQITNNGLENLTTGYNDHNWNETKIQINSLTLQQHSDQINRQQLTSKILPITSNHENKVNLVYLINFFFCKNFNNLCLDMVKNVK